MENTYKLKIKIGEHEFEAEGPVDIVRDQFTAFKELIAAAPSKPKEAAPQPQELTNGQMPHLPIEKVLKAEGRVVSLTAKCDTIEEAVLLILLGQKDFRANQEVSGAELMDGLMQSGYRLPRVDRIMDKLHADGNINTSGVHRGKRYRLTNAGLTRALSIAREIIATVP